MTHKEKADELIEKFRDYVEDMDAPSKGVFTYSLERELFNAKQCAIITVKEVISELESVEENITPHDFSGLLTFWDNVKFELEKP